MKMKSRRKWLALLMAFVMLTGTLSVTAFANLQAYNANSSAAISQDAENGGGDNTSAQGRQFVVKTDSNGQKTATTINIVATDPNASKNSNASKDSDIKIITETNSNAAQAKAAVQSDSNAEEPVQWDISKSKEATNLDENFESNVTLSLPAGDYKGDLDVVFVLDGSTSTDEDDLAGNAAGLLEELAGFKNLNVKAGLVVFGGSVPILYEDEELLVLSENDNLGRIKAAITDKSYDGIAGRSGSNLQAGVKAAQELLDADEAVDNADKYLILLTDGGARMWVNDKGKALFQTYAPNGKIFWNSNEDFYQRYISPQTKELREFDEIWNAGKNPDFSKYAMTESESKEEGAVDRAASWDAVLNDDNYYTALEVSTYYAATSIIEASQNSHVIWVDYPYHDGKYKEYTDSFKSWMADKKYVTRYDSTELDGNNIFDAVKDQLIYLLDAGSTVVDYMGYVEGDYNLDFINKAEALTLTVGGEKKDVVDRGDNTYGFGNVLDNGKYEYELTYYPADDGEEHFIWTINVPVTKLMPVKLTYKVKLVNPKSAPGTYGVYDKYGENNDGSAVYSLYTNNKATLNPVDSNGNEGDPEDFKKPTVSYIVEQPPEPEKELGNLTVYKIVSGNAGDTNKDFTFTVKLGDTAINGTYGEMTFANGAATFTLKHNEKKTAIGLPAGISYEVTESEANQNGYTTVASGSNAVITKNQTAAVTFTNTKNNNEEPQNDRGNLIVSKIVSGNAGDTKKDFTFTVKLGDTAINGTYGEMTFANGAATFTLKHNEKKTAIGLPAGISYEVTESEANQNGYTTTATGAVGSIGKDQTAAAAFTNRKTSGGGDGGGNDDGYGSLTVKKTVSGTAGDTEKAFTFTIKLNSSLSGTYGDMTFEKGVATIQLKHGESSTAKDLPSGIHYSVTESENEGYTVSAVGASGIIPDGRTVVAAFTNSKDTTPGTPDAPTTPDTPGTPDTPATPDTPENPEIPDQSARPSASTPKTGDESHTDFWFGLMVISFAAAAGICIYEKKRRYTADDK